MRLTTKEIAIEGNLIVFKRNGLTIIGEVVKVKDESVIVKISEEDAETLKYDTSLTVVAHKNYKLHKE